MENLWALYEKDTNEIFGFFNNPEEAKAAYYDYYASLMEENGMTPTRQKFERDWLTDVYMLHIDAVKR